MAFTLGALAFDDLRGDIELPQMNREVESRTGQDGLTVFNTGRRSKEFTLESIYAYDTYANACAAQITYANYFGLGAQNLVRDTASYTTTIKFIVLDVSIAVESAIVFHCLRGRIAPAFILRAQWRLQAVEV